MPRQLHVFASTLQKTNELLKSITDWMSWRDKNKAYLALRAVLHVLRDRLTVEHAVHFGAQLPMLVRGFYFEGWRPAEAPKKMTREEFIGEVERLFPTAPEESTETIIRGVMQIISAATDPNEIAKISATLPKDIAELIYSPAKPYAESRNHL